MSRKWTRLAPLLVVMLAGCGTVTSVQTDTSLRSFRPITMSCKDTPETRKQVTAHNSAYDTLKTGKVVAYKDSCPKAEQPAPTT